MNKFLSRRWLMTMGCGVACFVLVWFEKIDGAVFAAVIVPTVGAYIAGNTYQKTKSNAGI